jgi:hypothetical protein
MFVNPRMTSVFSKPLEDFQVTFFSRKVANHPVPRVPVFSQPPNDMQVSTFCRACARVLVERDIPISLSQPAEDFQMPVFCRTVGYSRRPRPSVISHGQ